MARHRAQRVPRVVLACAAVVSGQQVVNGPLHDSGQSITGAYEGWFRNADGSFSLLFGYYNRNQKQELDIAPGSGTRRARSGSAESFSGGPPVGCVYGDGPRGFRIGEAGLESQYEWDADGGSGEFESFVGTVSVPRCDRKYSAIHRVQCYDGSGKADESGSLDCRRCFGGAGGDSSEDAGGHGQVESVSADRDWLCLPMRCLRWRPLSLRCLRERHSAARQ